METDDFVILTALGTNDAFYSDSEKLVGRAFMKDGDQKEALDGYWQGRFRALGNPKPMKTEEFFFFRAKFRPRKWVNP
jgi:hypothetical protein